MQPVVDEEDSKVYAVLRRDLSLLALRLVSFNMTMPSQISHFISGQHRLRMYAVCGQWISDPPFVETPISSH